MDRKQIVIGVVAICTFAYLSIGMLLGKDLFSLNEGRALKSASLRLQDNREIVFVAVGNEGWALQYASPRLQDDLVFLVFFSTLILGVIFYFTRPCRRTKERKDEVIKAKRH